MILVDTGPLVALFDPKDSYHAHCRSVLKCLREPLYSVFNIEELLVELYHFAKQFTQLVV